MGKESYKRRRETTKKGVQKIREKESKQELEREREVREFVIRVFCF